MKRRIITIALVALAMLSLPNIAGAATCNMGITNGVTVASPNTIHPGEFQGQHYAITACTTVARVTIEWVRIINSGQKWLSIPANRVSYTGEIGQGTAMQGATSWQIPSDAPAGHYAVITRYYTTGSNAPEDVAGSSFIVELLPDVCPTLTGIQTSPPAGTVAPACVTPPVVVPTCPNIPTMTLAQAAAAGLTIDAAGNCIETVTPTGTTGSPNLKIFKTGNKKRVRQGSAVVFTVKVRNTGDADAGKTRICDFMPAGMVYIKHTGKAYFSAGRLCWTLARVGKGKTVIVGTVTVRIVKNRGRVVNVACIMRNAATGTIREACAKAPVAVIPRPEPTGGVTG